MSSSNGGQAIELSSPEGGEDIDEGIVFDEVVESLESDCNGQDSSPFVVETDDSLGVQTLSVKDFEEVVEHEQNLADVVQGDTVITEVESADAAQVRASQFKTLTGDTYVYRGRMLFSTLEVIRRWWKLPHQRAHRQ